MTTSFLTAKTTALCALMMGAAALTCSPNAEASDFGFSIQIGRPRPVVVREPVVVVQQPVRRWVPERYETRTEQVLVAPERHERHWVPEVVTITRHGKHGRETRTVTPGYWREVCIPAVYETRTSTVTIPGYWEEVSAGNGQCHEAPVVQQPVREYRRDEPRGVSIRAGYSDNRWNRR